jgi:hypothetical protein
MASSAQNSTGNTTSGNAIFWTSEHMVTDMVTSEHIFWTSELQNMPPTAFICRSDRQSPQPPPWICLDLAPCVEGLRSQLEDVFSVAAGAFSPRRAQPWRRRQDPRRSWGWRWVVRRGRRGRGGERGESSGLQTTTMRAQDPAVIESDRRAVQHCWNRLLCHGARASPVVSWDDAASVSKPRRGVFCKNNSEETSPEDPLYVPLHRLICATVYATIYAHAFSTFNGISLEV